jgi:DNA-binding response OmpR family regulator
MAQLILIVEDEKILAESISVYLERHAYATMVAFTGEDGVRMAERARPDVAVVDMRLPGIDGLEVLRRLRHMSPATEVIMATAHDSVAAAAEARKRGAFDYLSKPVDLDALRAVVADAVLHLPEVARRARRGI